MRVHRSARVCLVLAVNLAFAAASGSLRAESLADGLAQPAGRALKMGPWAIKVAPAPRRPRAGSWSPVVSVTLSVPEAKASATPSDTPHPYGLHGPIPENVRAPQTGLASYYGPGVGDKTATGERFDPSGMTAAHRTLPFGTRVKVTRVDTGDSVVVRINDRGPFKPGRVIDLSEGAAKTLRMTDVGLTNVRLEVLNRH